MEIRPRVYIQKECTGRSVLRSCHLPPSGQDFTSLHHSASNGPVLRWRQSPQRLMVCRGSEDAHADSFPYGSSCPLVMLRFRDGNWDKLQPRTLA